MRIPAYSVVLVRALAKDMETLGLRPDDFLAALGVTPDTDKDAFLSIVDVERALRATAKRSRDGALGLHIAAASPLGNIGLYDYAIWASPTLHVALARWSHYLPCLVEGLTMRVEEMPPVARLSCWPNGGAASSVIEDIALGVVVTRARQCVGAKFRVRSVELGHPPRERAPYEAFFGTKDISFDQPTTAIAFDSALLHAPLRTADPEMVEITDAHIRGKRPPLEPVDPFLDRIRTAILRGLSVGSSGLDALARQLGRSRRTLQRQLGEHGTTLRQVTEKVQREVAFDLLDRGEASTAEIAYRLGFARPAAFQRAFRRWTGESPASYRKARRGAKTRTG